MEFKWIYSKVEPVNILLRNFSFFHQTTGEKTDPKYILDREPNQQLYNWLKYNEADSASYLITGHRGAGKSSLVNYTIKQLIDENATFRRKNKKQYIKISISLEQEFLEEIEILRILARNLQEEFKAHTPLSISILKIFVSTFAFISKLIVIISLLIFALKKLTDDICFISFADNVYLIKLTDKLSGSQWILDFCNTLITPSYLLLIPIISFGVWFVTKKIYNSTHFQKVYRQIQTLCIRLNTTITDEEESSLKIKLEQWMTNIGISNRRKKVSPPASIQEIEFELIKIINEFQKKNQQLIIVFDELDKVDTNLRDMVNKKDSINPEFEKLSTRPEQHVSSRVRTQQVLKIVANMKYFLSTAKAYFIFIAGRELFEAFQADMCDRDFSISSIFNGVLNIESFLNGKSGIFNNSVIKTEEFVCRQLLPPNFQKEVEGSGIYNPKMIYSLKNYYIFRNTEIINLPDKKKKKQKERIYQEIQFLYHFVNYLAFISNGSPKKITLFFEKYVRSQDYLENVENAEFPQNEKQAGKDAKNTFYLSWGFRKIQKVNFIHYLTYPMIQGLLNRNSHSGDKLLISSSFLLTYILKLHNNGFSWRNLEQTPELQELNKTPEMRDYLSTFINFMNHNLVLTIPCGLYHYKFPMRIIEEISYHSRLSGEMSTLFNFSSTDLQGIKNQYIQLLEQNSTSDNKSGNSQYTVASTLHSLGDLYLLEENYSAAIRSYEQCLEIILPIFENYQHTAMTQAENYLVFTNRTMLKLGLAHEKRGTSNSAFILYDELIGLLKQMCTKEKYRSFFYDIRTIHLSILAKLFILEKIDTNGITPAHLQESIKDFQTIINSTTKKLNGKNIESKVIETDFYRKLGDILYYKNQEYKLNNETTNALSCYLKSVEVLWNNDRLSSSNLNKTIKEITRNVSILKNGLKTSNAKDEKESIFLKDNEIYHLALSLESIGNVCLSTKSISLSTKKIYKINNFSTFCENFSKVITSPNKESELAYITRLNITNNFERAIICHWDAAHLYSLSCERGSSIKCYKNIVYTLLLYTRNQIKERKMKATNSNELLQLMENLINHFLIHLHRQKEHIHLPEINYIQWLHSAEMYQPIPYESLSVTPDAEEILFLYYTTKLELWNNALLTDDNHVQDLVRFYQSPTMTGKNAYQTMFSSTLLLKLKARFNQILLNKLLNIRNGEEDFKQISIEKIQKFIKSEITESEILKQFFNCKTLYSGAEKNRMDLLDTLIMDSIYCLARIQEQIIPIQNSMVFNNSFKADVFYNQFKMAVMYQYLYCYYRYTEKRKEKIETFLKLVNGEKNADTNCLKELPSNNERGKELYRMIRDATHYNNQNCTNILFLGESCIHYYTKARQAHTQGKTYQEIIKNLYFLEDDLNNDCSPFHMAIERLEITTGHIKDREDKLKAILSKAPVYNGQTYFTSNLDFDKA